MGKRNLFFIIEIIFIIASSTKVLAATDPSTISPLLYRQKIMSTQSPSSNKIRVAFFDADSTLRVSNSGMPWATEPTDYIILPGVIEKIKQLNNQGYFVAIVSNQGQISRLKNLKITAVDQALYNLIQELKLLGARIDYFDFAEQDDEFRKPNIGMFNFLEQALKFRWGPNVEIDRQQSFMVGDAGYTSADVRPDGSKGSDFSNVDRKFAENAKIGFYYASDFFKWNAFGLPRIKNRFHAKLVEKRMTSCSKLLEMFESETQSREKPAEKN